MYRFMDYGQLVVIILTKVKVPSHSTISSARLPSGTILCLCTVIDALMDDTVSGYGLS